MPDLNTLTPPASPPRRAGSSSDLKIDFEHLEPLRSSIEIPRLHTYTDDGIIKCPYHVTVVMTPTGEKQMFGYGAWSNVYKATCQAHPPIDNGLLTPPLRSMNTPPLVVAVKSPARKDAIAILREEAKTLSHLRLCDPDENYIAVFYGIIGKDSELVMAAHPLSLEDHIMSCATIAEASRTTSNMKLPVLGSTMLWLDLASKLIDALDWMHNDASIVHGDIKPRNILLRPLFVTSTDEFSFTPLFIDFSSSQRLDSDTIVPNTLSAITTEYTAPELLSVAVLNDPKSCATTHSDIFSLAVTLLVAATGDTKVYGNYSGQQKLMLAKQGSFIIANVRSFSLRVPRHGTVSKVLEKAVLKKDSGRITTAEWKKLVKNIQAEMRHNGSKI